MKFLLITVAFFAVVVFLAGCLKKNIHPPMQTVEQVDLTRYTGRWYEIARYPHRFEKGCSSVTADYTLEKDGSIKVLNQCILKDEGGKVKQAHGKAKVVDTKTNAKLKVSFFWPFYGDYWILHLDPEYQFVIVGAPSRKYVWILARKPHLPSSLMKQLLEEIKRQGYDTDQLILTEHPTTPQS
jgi:apolipoprotein D and lipocalin family protein